MTKSTPECLSRTDFHSLVRNDSALARVRLVALIADPEALNLYGEALASKGSGTRRLSDHLEWDDIRQRILREGLGESTLDDDTLARLAQDLDALTELQFDLYSTETPQDLWKRALAMQPAGVECSEVCCVARCDEPFDDRGMASEAANGYSGVVLAKLTAEGEVNPNLSLAPGPCDFPHPKSSFDSIGSIDASLGGEGLCVRSEARLNFQSCLVDGPGWLHQSTQLIDHSWNRSLGMVMAHCDTGTRSTPTPLCEDREWEWLLFETLTSTSTCLRRSSERPGALPHAPETGRPRRACHGRGGSMWRWIQRRVSFLRSWSYPCKEMSQDDLVAQIDLFSGSLSTYDVRRSKGQARSIVVFADVAIQTTVDHVILWVDRHALTSPEDRPERDGDVFWHPDGQLLRKQLPAPCRSGIPRRELASTT